MENCQWHAPTFVIDEFVFVRHVAADRMLAGCVVCKGRRWHLFTWREACSGIRVINASRRERICGKGARRPRRPQRLQADMGCFNSCQQTHDEHPWPDGQTVPR
jgi:hypothetical protein